LSIWLARTPTQSAAEALSMGALLAFAITLIIWRKPQSQGAATSRIDARLIMVMIVTGTGLLFLKTAVIDRIPNPLRAERFPETAEIVPGAVFSGFITLLDVAHPNVAESGQNADLTLFWRLTNMAVAADYSSIVHLRDDAGHIVAEAGSFMPGSVATSNWVPGLYVADKITLSIPSHTPPGTYTLDVGLYNPQTMQRLDVLDVAGNPAGVAYTLGTLAITRPDRVEGAVDALDAPVIADLRLLDITGLPPIVTVGEPLTIGWTWQATAPLAADVQARLVWGCDASPLSTPPLTLVRDYDTVQWQPGDIWTGRHTVYVPGDLEAGDTCVGVRLEGDDTTLVTSPITIQTPDRDFSPPAPDTPLAIEWQNGIELLGVDASGVSTLTLYWRTAAPIHTSLRLFVHLVGQDGQIAAVSDGVPDDWTRPTSGWAVGETITTQHHFDGVPPGRYRVRTGWVDPSTGERVHISTDSTDSQEDSALLPLEVVIP
jgi:hypothetical protein